MVTLGQNMNRTSLLCSGSLRFKIIHWRLLSCTDSLILHHAQQRHGSVAIGCMGSINPYFHEKAVKSIMSQCLCLSLRTFFFFISSLCKISCMSQICYPAKHAKESLYEDCSKDLWNQWEGGILYTGFISSPAGAIGLKFLNSSVESYTYTLYKYIINDACLNFIDLLLLLLLLLFIYI